MHSKGFTLLELLLVLSGIAILLAIVPMIHIPSGVKQSDSIHKMYQYILQAQARAICEKRDIYVDFQGHRLFIDKQEVFHSSTMVCESCRLYFTPTGTISKAASVDCYGTKKHVQFVFQLGSGLVYVR